VSLLFEDIPRAPGSLFETVISSYRRLFVSIVIPDRHYRKASQKLISLITSTLLSVVKFEFFEDLSWIMLSDEVLHYLLAGWLTF
jgi:hypothetical protein